jgi:hypothetical protein
MKRNLYASFFNLFLVITFILGLYVTMYFDKPTKPLNKKETLSNMGESCPNLLVQRGNVLMLYNTEQPTVDGSNPMPFFNLDEYIHYLELQKEQGIDCPVLFLQQENNAQGNDVYRMRPSPFDLQGGVQATNNLSQEDIDKIGNVVKAMDASRKNPPYNENNYPGFDPHGHYVGQYTDIDMIHDSTNSKRISDNPMDSKWAGTTYTQQMVESGKYDDNAITRPRLFNPKTLFIPSIPSVIPLPQDHL